ncbi:MAG TPA: transglutaminaseTgpA domain-containing protein [Gemmataceae bacterium]|nr:transglutaminaseTgpA domain-containing protein [Gemmataceae bacterium]
MTLNLAARVTGYLTLALAVACLACADATFVPALPWLLPIILVVLVVGFVAEGRGWVLPAWVANVLGIGIVVAVTGGVVVYVLGKADVPGDDRPLALLLLPYIGPFLLVLALVKLFRPKTASDLWALQGLGLLMAGLGCVLADGGPFGALLLAYLVCGAWHLALAYLRREELRTTATRPARGAVPWRALGVLHGPRSVLAAGLLAVPVFLLLPRAGDEPWTPLILAGPHGGKGAGRGNVGLTAGIDLNRTETLDPADEVAVQVEAFHDRTQTQPKTDLRPTQRWRGLTLDSYENGRWGPGRTLLANSVLIDEVMGQPQLLPPPPPQTRPLPDLGRGQYYLNLTVLPRKAGGLVLAEPAVVRGRVLPVAPALGEARVRPLFQEMMGILTPVPQPHDRTEVRYRQVVPQAADPNLSEPGPVHVRYAALISRPPAGPLGPWTRALVARLARPAGSDLRPADIEPVAMVGGWTWPRDPERVARALTTYLSSSGDYTYSFEQERSDSALDPTFDFLVNVRHGPCTRFASALALMLRSLGLPARVVLGFRGCEHLGGGHYQVLSSQAHAWVEVLVGRPGPEGTTLWHWLTLDPTPSAEEVPRPSFSLVRWWEKHGDASAALWRDYIVEYNPNTQGNVVLGALSDSFAGTEESLPNSPAAGLLVGAAVALGAVALGAGCLVWFKRRRPARARHVSRVPFYARLLDVLARRHGLRPLPAQTAREFAAEAGRILREQPATAGLAELPARLAELFYRVAYGGRPLTDDEAHAVQRELDALAAAR